MTARDESRTAHGAPRLFVEPELLREMVQSAVQAVLYAEADEHVGAALYERSPERRAYRNGTKPRTMKTSVGELRLRLPQVRESGFRTQAFERFQRSDRALVAAMQEMVVSGVSTRRVSAVMEAMGGFEVSAATVSRTMVELDELIQRFLQRSLEGQQYPYLVVDARYEKVRKGGRVVSQAVLVAAGVRADGRRELLGFALGDSESADSWGSLFADLRRRGLRGVRLMVSDAHKGIRAAFAKHFQSCIWQRCRVHFMRELIAKVNYRQYRELASDLRSVYASASREQCLAVAAEVAAKWQSRAPRMSAALLEGVEDTLAAWDLPTAHRRRMNSTNMLERLMKEIRQRTRTVGSFPNEQACWRLVGALLLEVQDRWDEERQRYLVMEDSPPPP